MGWQDKRCCASSPSEHVRLYRNTRLWLSSTRCFYLIYLQCPCLVYFMNYLIHAAPVIHLYTYSVFHPVVYCNYYYCCFYFTAAVIPVTTDKLLRARLLSGAAELTTHLL